MRWCRQLSYHYVHLPLFFFIIFFNKKVAFPRWAFKVNIGWGKINTELWKFFPFELKFPQYPIEFILKKPWLQICYLLSRFFIGYWNSKRGTISIEPSFFYLMLWSSWTNISIATFLNMIINQLRQYTRQSHQQLDE